MTIQCPTCLRVFPDEHTGFSVDSHRKSGRRSVCRACDHKTFDAKSYEDPGYIYIMAHPLMRGLKVGKTVDLAKRLSHANTHCPLSAFRMVYTVFSKDTSNDDWKIMREIKDRRLFGEWYDIRVSGLRDVIDKHVVFEKP